ncbi:MAG: hypothetical protein ABEH86_02810 [Haloarcula sp.]
MKRRYITLGFAVLFGLLFVAIGAVIGLAETPRPAVDGPGVAGGLALFIGFLVAVWKLWQTPDGPDVSPSPWSDADEFTAAHIETTPTEEAISGTDLAKHVEAAASQARDGATVAESLNPVREPLRDTLIHALVESGKDRETVMQQLAAGTWTDDRVAAAVLDGNVTPLDRPFRARLRAWLFPEKAVRKRSARAMAAVSAAADDALPTIVGQRAPRPVPVVAPGVADLKRAADGSLQRAVNGSLRPREDIDTSGNEPAKSAGTSESSESVPETVRGGNTAYRATTNDEATGAADWADVTEVRD